MIRLNTYYENQSNVVVWEVSFTTVKFIAPRKGGAVLTYCSQENAFFRNEWFIFYFEGVRATGMERRLCIKALCLSLY